jgi:hypothetical protein
MGAMMTHTMTSVVMVVVVVMPARGPTVHRMIMPRGVMGFVACRGGRARRNNDCSTEEKYAEEFH